MLTILTNDDGIEAPGLAALHAAIREITGFTPVIVAPQAHWSGCGHTLTTGRDIPIEQRPDGAWAVHGTPADCVRAALTHLVPEAQLILSGINRGGNLGFDVFCSGTVAAVREGASHGVPGIAFSHYVRRGIELDWVRAAQWVAQIVPLLVATPFRCLSVNLPHLDPGAADPEVIRCAVDPSPLPLAMTRSPAGLRYSGDYHGRARLPGHDVAVCFGGRVSVVELMSCP